MLYLVITISQFYICYFSKYSSFGCFSRKNKKVQIASKHWCEMCPNSTSGILQVICTYCFHFITQRICNCDV